MILVHVEHVDHLGWATKVWCFVFVVAIAVMSITGTMMLFAAKGCTL